MIPTYLRAMSHFGRFRVSGNDAAALLHHLTTNNIKKLRSGEGCDAILITNKGRILDWLNVWRDGEEYFVLTSPNRRAMFAPHARSFVLYRQDVQIEDVSDSSGLFGVFGGETEEVLLKASLPLPSALNEMVEAELDELSVRVSRTRRLPDGGLFLVSEDSAGLKSLINDLELPLCDDATFNALRIEAGIPVAGFELTEENNPWEANLDFAISLDKGCYNGQEIIARLNTYQKIKQRLMGLRLESTLENGQRIALKCEGRDAGVLTSSARSPSGAVGLGYVRRDFAEDAAELEVASTPPQRATVASLPFSS